MTKAEKQELLELIKSNLDKLTNSSNPYDYFFLVSMIKEQLDELLEDKFLEVSEIWTPGYQTFQNTRGY